MRQDILESKDRSRISNEVVDGSFRALEYAGQGACRKRRRVDGVPAQSIDELL